MSETLQRVEDKAHALKVIVDDLVHKLIEDPDDAEQEKDHRVISLDSKGPRRKQAGRPKRAR